MGFNAEDSEGIAQKSEDRGIKWLGISHVVVYQENSKSKCHRERNKGRPMEEAAMKKDASWACG